MTLRFRDWLNEQLQDPEFRAEYEALQAEEELIQAVIDARKANGLTEKQLAKKAGVTRLEIKDIESGKTELSLRMLQTLAGAMNLSRLATNRILRRLP